MKMSSLCSCMNRSRVSLSVIRYSMCIGYTAVRTQRHATWTSSHHSQTSICIHHTRTRYISQHPYNSAGVQITSSERKNGSTINQELLRCDKEFRYDGIFPHAACDSVQHHYVLARETSSVCVNNTFNLGYDLPVVILLRPRKLRSVAASRLRLIGWLVETLIHPG